MSGKNIILIGMPASGKSSLGVILAKVLGKSFVDTDLVIQQRENSLLCDIIAKDGITGFMEKEESAVLSIHPENSVIATGGSVVYSAEGMKHLSGLGRIIYLKVEKKELFKRLKNIKERGVVLQPGESLDEMFDTRELLYEKYADITIEEKNRGIEEVIESITECLLRECPD